MATYYVPSINLMGAGCLNELGSAIQGLNLNKAFVVTDKFLVKCGVVKKVTDILESKNIEFEVYDEIIPG